MDKTVQPVMSQKARRHGAPSPLQVTLRVLAAGPASYCVAALASMTLARWSPTSASEAVTTGMLAGLVLCCLAPLWCFAARKLVTVWIGLLILATALGVLLALSYFGFAP